MVIIPVNFNEHGEFDHTGGFVRPGREPGVGWAGHVRKTPTPTGRVVARVIWRVVTHLVAVLAGMALMGWVG